jgi:Oligoendopeptidase F
MLIGGGKMEQKLTWDLHDLFGSDEEFYNEIEKVNRDVEGAIKFKSSIFDSNILLTVLNLKCNIKEKANNILIYGSLNYYKDVESEVTKRMKETAEQLVAKVDSTLGFIDEKIVELGQNTIHNYLIFNEKLKIYELYLNNIFRLRSHIQNEETNIKIEKLTNNISNILTNYNSINRDIDLGNIIVNDEEIKLTPSNIAKYLSSRDRETRKQAYLSVNCAYKKKANLFSKMLNDLYSDRVRISDLEQYSSVSEKALFDENINPVILEKLIVSVRSNVSLMKNI